MAVGRKYEIPAGVDLSEVQDLTPESKGGAELKPTTLVVGLNRGPREIRDQYNAEPYVIPPYAAFRCEYQVAAHIQRRNIVAGTRNPDPTDATAPQYVPWIVIIGLDPEEHCRVFTPEELEAFGEKPEGLNRDLMRASDRGIEVKSTASLRKALPGGGNAPSATAGLRGGGGGLNQRVDGGPEVTDDSIDRALEKVEGSDAVIEQLAAAGAGHQMPTEAQLSVKSAPLPVGAGKGHKK